MTRTVTVGLVASALWLVGVAPIGAHHAASAEFDPKKPITFKGAVTKVEWLNPHVYTHVEVTEPDGKVVVYRVEGMAPNYLFRQGWRKDSLKIGEIVTVTGLRAKNEASLNIGQATITTADGRQMFSQRGGAQAAAQTQAPRQ